MVREIVHDPMLLGQKSTLASEDDKQVALDLLETLQAHRNECVGMAANMIGVKKSIIAVSVGFSSFIMINPEIIWKKKPYDTEESCLSLLGGPRKCKRFEEIGVKYLDINWQQKTGSYSGYLAQIIQHEVDHINGVLI